MTEGVTEEAVCTIAGIALFGIRPRQWLYPIEAIRELMINSLVHRDWSRFVDVEITGYNNRLEIISPGSLPNSMTIEKMLAGQRSARNNLIVEVMRDYGYVDARGMGVRTKVLPALKKSGNDQKFSATDDFVQFSLFLKGQRSTEDAPLNKKEHEASGIKGQNAPLSGQYDLLNDLLNQIIGQPEADYQTLAQALNVSEATVKRHIQKLKQMNRLQRKGSKKTGHWEVIEP